jgi:hypothetical protein
VSDTADIRASSRRTAVCVAVVFLVAAVVRLPGLGSAPAAWLSAAAGALTAAFVAIVAARLAGPRGATWAGLLVALSPIHVLACREGSPSVLLVACLAASLALVLLVEAGARLEVSVVHGLLVGVLAATGGASLAAIAVLQVVWLAVRADRRRVAAVSVLAAVLVLVATGALGFLRSPFAPIEAAGWIPPTTLSRLVRCSGASFTRVVGLEYQLSVPHARWVSPLTLVVAGLAALGALRTPRRARWLLVTGALLPFALAAVLALATGRVTPLQAARLVDALPFLAVLEGAGLASLERPTAVLLGGGLLAILGTFLALVLAVR